MVNLCVVVHPLVQYDMFSWKEYNYSPKFEKIHGYAYTHNNPIHNHIGFQHVRGGVLGGKEVDIPCRLWEDLYFSNLHSRLGYVRL